MYLVTGINVSELVANHPPCGSKYKFDDRKCNSK